MKDRRLSNITVGEILEEEYLRPLEMSPYALAKALHVSPMRISLILRGKRAITPDTAIRLGVFFKTTPQFWLNLQAGCDLRALEEKKEEIARLVRPYDFPARMKAA